MNQILKNSTSSVTKRREENELVRLVEQTELTSVAVGNLVLVVRLVRIVPIVVVVDVTVVVAQSE